MTEAEHLDRLLYMIVQEEIKKLSEMVAKTTLWQWHFKCLLYLKNNNVVKQSF